MNALELARVNVSAVARQAEAHQHPHRCFRIRIRRLRCHRPPLRYPVLLHLVGHDPSSRCVVLAHRALTASRLALCLDGSVVRFCLALCRERLDVGGYLLQVAPSVEAQSAFDFTHRTWDRRYAGTVVAAAFTGLELTFSHAAFAFLHKPDRLVGGVLAKNDDLGHFSHQLSLHLTEPCLGLGIEAWRVRARTMSNCFAEQRLLLC